MRLATKHAAAIGSLVAITVMVMIFAAADPESGDSKTAIGLVPSDLPQSSGYVALQTDRYELEIPAGWQAQPPDLLADLMVADIIAEATKGRIRDSKFYGYAEPEPPLGSIVPASIMVHTAESELSQREYEAALSDIMALSEERYGMDVDMLGSRQDELAGRPAITVEYSITYPADLDLPPLRVVETITTAGDTVYSVSYGAEAGAYGEHLQHFERAVRTFTVR